MYAFENQRSDSSQSELDASSALLESTWVNIPVPPDRPAALDRRVAPDRQRAPEQAENPQPTAQQIQAMHASAAEGRLDNDTARRSVVRAVETNGARGLIDFRDEMNTQLAQANSDYRARVVRADGPNGVINLYLILQDQRNNENLADMVRDLQTNGANSPYRNRAVHLELTPAPRPDV